MYTIFMYFYILLLYLYVLISLEFLCKLWLVVSLVLSVSWEVFFGLHLYVTLLAADFCRLVGGPKKCVNMFQHVSTHSLSFSLHGLNVVPGCEKQLHPHEKLRRRTHADSGRLSVCTFDFVVTSIISQSPFTPIASICGLDSLY